jgi:hypothetical protein
VGRDSNRGTGLQPWDGTPTVGRDSKPWDGTRTLGRATNTGTGRKGWERQIPNRLAFATKPELGHMGRDTSQMMGQGRVTFFLMGR